VAKISAKNLFRRNDSRCATLTVEITVLEEKLEAARLSTARRRKLIMISLFAAIVFCGAVVIGLSSFNFSDKKSGQSVPVEKEKLAETDTEIVRTEFKAILQQYENELEPRLQTINLKSWDRDAFSEIDELKKETMLIFSSGDYANALQNLLLLKNRTVEILNEADRAFKEHLGKAASFWQKDLYNEAKLHIEKSLAITPLSPEALELQQKIEKLPYILPLLRKVKTARAENNFQKEYDLLKEILSITRERKEIGERLELLAKLIKNQKFNTYISMGFAGIETGQVKEARHYYQEAKKIDPERKELTLLWGQVLALEKSRRVQNAIEKAKQAVRRDDWQQVKINYTKAAQEAPTNRTVIEGLKRSNQVLELQKQFNQYFRNPYRLANDDVLREAENILARSEIISGYSFKIKTQAEQLRELIIKLNRLIPVTVFSDNKTYVSVRSVGRVGIVLEKIIELKPGYYTFEGTRDGFKSKLVQALIPFDQDNFSIRIICDEPI